MLIPQVNNDLINLINSAINRYGESIKPTNEEIWAIAKTFPKAPNLDNIYLQLFFNHLEDKLKEDYEDLDINYVIDDQDSQFFINDESIFDIQAWLDNHLAEIKTQMKIDISRFDELQNFGYHWFGFYPLKSQFEIKQFCKIIGKHNFYILYPDDTEATTNYQTAMAHIEKQDNNILIGVDITKLLPELPMQDFYSPSKVKQAFYERQK